MVYSTNTNPTPTPITLSAGVRKCAISDHDLIFTVIKDFSFSEPQNHVEMSFRDTRNLDTDQFLSEIRVAFHNIQPDWEIWYKTFNEICNKHAPIVTRRISRKQNPWIDEDVLRLLHDRDFAKDMHNKTGDEAWKDKFHCLKKQCSIIIKLKKMAFFKDTQHIQKSNPKKFYKNMSRFMPNFNPKSIPKSMNAEDFNKYFCNVAAEIDKNFTDTSLPIGKSGSNENKFTFTPFSEQQIKKELMSLNTQANLDILGIDRKLLQLSAII